jgi:four helix bundle protein
VPAFEIACRLTFGIEKTMSNFQQLDVWQKARILARDIYQETRSFPREELFGLTQQMRRAAISIISNIAEGKGRFTRGEYRSFLIIARGSVFELEAQLIIAVDLEFLGRNQGDALVERAREIARMLNGVIRHLVHRPPATSEPPPATCDQPPAT